jgi:dTDP-4-amino-4,6-dideoxygalactose transaminase
MINVTKSDLPPLENYVQYLNKIWNSRWLTNNGEFAQLFERKLEEYLQIKRILPVANGTFALQVALKALDLKGEVITTPFTFAATTNAILWEGLTPVFADIDPETFNIDPADVERKITNKTSAILAVHTYGNPCYVDELQKIAETYGLKLIYDAAHAFGVQYNDKSVLDYGDICTLSFHATKVFHTIEGGAIVAKKDEHFDKIKLLINHGIKSEEKVAVVGTNAKMNEFQAAMGLCNLEYINERIKLREKIYTKYKSGFSDSNVQFQKIVSSRYNYSYMPVCFENISKRDEIYLKLINYGIKSRKYFYPLTVNSDYFNNENLVEKYGLNFAYDVSNRILCLPLYTDLEETVVDNIIDIIKG